PALEQRTELDHAEEQRNEDHHHQGRLERRDTAIVPERQRTAESCVTSACSRATSPLFHADTPATRVPSTTAAPITYSIVASPSDARRNRPRPRIRTPPCDRCGASRY